VSSNLAADVSPRNCSLCLEDLAGGVICKYSCKCSLCLEAYLDPDGETQLT
jgi:hypothetical protein